MKYTIERLPESQVAVEVELADPVVEKALDRAARSISKRVRIPGFRPGKAPRYIIEARYGRAVLYEEVTDDLIRNAYREILEKNEFEPIAEAELENLSFEPFTFRLLVPVQPTVKLGDYRALRFSEEVEEIGDEEVQAELKRMQQEQTLWIAPDPPRPAQIGDRLIIDLVLKADETELQHQEGVEITLGDENLLAEFTEQLADVQLGQTVDIEVTLSEGFEDESLAGEPATYSVTVNAIKEAETPSLDDDFAQTFGQEDTLEALHVRIRAELEEKAQKKAREELIGEMIDAIVQGAEVDMPRAMVQYDVEQTFRQQADSLQSQQLSMEQFLGYLDKTEEEYREDLYGASAESVRRSLVLQELIRAEDLTVEDAEAEAEIERILGERFAEESSAEQREEARESLSQPAVRDQILTSLLSRKLEETLLSIAKGEIPEEAAVEQPEEEELVAEVEEAELAEERVADREEPEEIEEKPTQVSAGGETMETSSDVGDD